MTDRKAIQVLALPRYDCGGASSRVRLFQFESYLAREAIRLTWAPMLDASYLERLYSGSSRSLRTVAGCYFRRARDLFGLGRYDAVWLEKELWPWMPAIIDPGVLSARIPYVVDYDDAIFHNYDQHASPLIRRVFSSKIDAVMRHAHTVVAGNEYLAERARKAGASRVVVLPSVVDKDAYPPHVASDHGGIVIGWIGSPGSQALLEPLFPILEECLDAGDRFVTVGARFGGPRIRNHEVLPWSLGSEADQVARFDIGVMPVRDAPFERGKCGYKLIQYMAAGVPVIASPVGVNSEIVVQGQTGYLASTPEDWTSALAKLKRDASLRTTMGAAGRLLMEQRYCTQVVGPQLAGILHAAARKGG